VASFVGRQTELAQLRRQLQQVNEGRPRLVVVEGPAGIGKTALIRRFLDTTTGPRTLWASGEESEKTLSMGVIVQLARLASEGSPPSLLSAEGNTERAIDPFAAGAALVDLLGEIQRAGPVVAVVDDAHWADHPSPQALTFVLRRLRLDPILSIVLVRDVADPQVPEGLRRLLVSDQTLRIALYSQNRQPSASSPPPADQPEPPSTSKAPTSAAPPMSLSTAPKPATA
jgi:predicted ATPase